MWWRMLSPMLGHLVKLPCRACCPALRTACCCRVCFCASCNTLAILSGSRSWGTLLGRPRHLARHKPYQFTLNRSLSIWFLETVTNKPSDNAKHHLVAQISSHAATHSAAHVAAHAAVFTLLRALLRTPHVAHVVAHTTAPAAACVATHAVAHAAAHAGAHAAAHAAGDAAAHDTADVTAHASALSPFTPCPPPPSYPLPPTPATLPTHKTKQQPKVMILHRGLVRCAYIYTRAPYWIHAGHMYGPLLA
jgi:hypothetical protein